MHRESRAAAPHTTARFDHLWRTFVVQVTIAHNLGRIASYHGSAAPQAGFSDHFMASLLLQRLATLVDAGLGDFIDSNGLSMTVHERRRGLAGRAACLVRLGYIDSSPTLQALSLVGDAIGSKADCLIAWPLLELHIDSAQVELVRLGLVVARPDPAFYGNRTPSVSGRPGIYMDFSIAFGVEDSKTHVILVEFSSRYSSPRP